MKHFHSLTAALTLALATAAVPAASAATIPATSAATVPGTPAATIPGTPAATMPGASAAGPAAYWLLVSLRDGADRQSPSIQGFPADDLPKITIKDGVFTVSSAARTVSYDATSIDRFRLTDTPEGLNFGPDVNRDGIVDVADIAAVIDVMASAPVSDASAATIPGASAAGPADVNADGQVDVADIAVIIDAMAAN